MELTQDLRILELKETRLRDETQFLELTLLVRKQALLKRPRTKDYKMDRTF